MNKMRFIVAMLVLCSGTMMGQRAHLWSTHGFSKFIYTPGLEGNYFFNSLVGIQFGSSIYLQSPDNYIVNRTFSQNLNYYDSNLGVVARMFQHRDFHMDFTLGAKFYYGPHYKKVAHYDHYDKNIYADVSHLRLDYGLDVGTSCSYKHVSVLFKYDTAYNILRIGIGYCFRKTSENITSRK